MQRGNPTSLPVKRIFLGCWEWHLPTHAPTYIGYIGYTLAVESRFEMRPNCPHQPLKWPRFGESGGIEAEIRCPRVASTMYFYPRAAE